MGSLLRKICSSLPIINDILPNDAIQLPISNTHSILGRTPMDFFNSSDFNKHVNELIEQWHTPGLAVAVVQDQNIASRGYGKASLDAEKPVTPDTLFDIASSSKSLTAASVALLVNDDEHYPQVKWEATMSSLLSDDFVMSEDSYTENVTVEDILSHRTGLPSHDLSYLGIRAEHPDTPQSVTRNLRNLEIAAPIRTKWMYCNLMFTVATYLVEQMSGLLFADFIHKHFFVPLGMNSTHLLPDATIEAGLEDRMAKAYHWDFSKGAYKPVIYQQMPEAIGAGSIFTSVNDYVRWVKALMNREHPISDNVYRGLLRPRAIEDSDVDLDEQDYQMSPLLYAVGLETTYYRGHKIVVHNGGIPGFGSIHFFLPVFKFGGVILGNSDSAGVVATIISRELIDEVLKVPHDERTDWNAVSEKSESDYEKRQEERVREREEKAKASANTLSIHVPLHKYTGKYWNPGYHGMTVEIRDDKLFVDASDRSQSFHLTFEHLCDGTQFTANMEDFFDGIVEKLEAEFKFENDGVTQMGINLEWDVEDLIWFDKVHDTVLTDQSRSK